MSLDWIEPVPTPPAFRAAHPDHVKLLPPDLRDWRPAEKESGRFQRPT